MVEGQGTIERLDRGIEPTLYKEALAREEATETSMTLRIKEEAEIL